MIHKQLWCICNAAVYTKLSLAETQDDIAALQSFLSFVSGHISPNLNIQSSLISDVTKTFAGFKSPTTISNECKNCRALVI